MELRNEFQISFRLVQITGTINLGLRKVATKFVPKLLSVNQKENQKPIATDFLECSKSDKNCLKSIINCDSTWVYGFFLFPNMKIAFKSPPFNM